MKGMKVWSDGKLVYDGDKLFNFGDGVVLVLDERVSVDRAGLIRSLELAKGLPCTSTTCLNASRWGKVMCDRCQLVNELTTVIGDAK